MKTLYDPLIQVLRDGDESICFFSELEPGDTVYSSSGTEVTIATAPVVDSDGSTLSYMVYDTAYSAWFPEELSSGGAA